MACPHMVWANMGLVVVVTQLTSVLVGVAGAAEGSCRVWRPGGNNQFEDEHAERVHRWAKSKGDEVQ
jgi:hypothetical protein